MPFGNSNLQIAPGLLAELAEAMQNDSDVSSRRLLSAFAEYMQSQEPDGVYFLTHVCYGTDEPCRAPYPTGIEASK